MVVDLRDGGIVVGHGSPQLGLGQPVVREIAASELQIVLEVLFRPARQDRELLRVVDQVPWRGRVEGVVGLDEADHQQMPVPCVPRPDGLNGAVGDPRGGVMGFRKVRDHGPERVPILVRRVLAILGSLVLQVVPIDQAESHQVTVVVVVPSSRPVLLGERQLVEANVQVRRREVHLADRLGPVASSPEDPRKGGDLRRESATVVPAGVLVHVSAREQRISRRGADGKWAEAAGDFAAGNKYVYNPEKFKANNNLALSGAKLKRKSPLVASLLSIIPGMGYAYAGYYQTAATSLITNSALAYAVYTSLKTQNYGIAILTGSLNFGFYIGNIIGGNSSVKRKYARQKQQIINTLENVNNINH